MIQELGGPWLDDVNAISGNIMEPDVCCVRYWSYCLDVKSADNVLLQCSVNATM